MDLVHFDPFRDLDRFFFDRARATTWAPRLDILDRKDDLVIRVEIPGVDPQQVEVTVEDRTLSISGSRSFVDEVEEKSYHRREIMTGEFRRTIVLPEGLDTGEIKANAGNGVLEIAIPRRPEVLPRKVQVDVTS